MNIVLVGMMGAGKSTVGMILARELGRPYMDTDTLVELKAGRAIRQIFQAEGEAGFRRREAAVIAEVAAGDGQVIATGGGAVIAPANREALRQSGLVFWLDAAPEELYARAYRQGVAARPLLAGPDPLGRIRELAVERADAYVQAAHHRIAAGGREPADVAAEILAIVRTHEGDHV